MHFFIFVIAKKWFLQGRLTAASFRLAKIYVQSLSPISTRSVVMMKQNALGLSKVCSGECNYYLWRQTAWEIMLASYEHSADDLHMSFFLLWTGMVWDLPRTQLKISEASFSSTSVVGNHCTKAYCKLFLEWQLNLHFQGVVHFQHLPKAKLLEEKYKVKRLPIAWQLWNTQREKLSRDQLKLSESASDTLVFQFPVKN